MNSKGSLNDSSDGSIEENDIFLTESIIRNLVDKTNFTRNQVKQFHSSFLKDFPSGKLNRGQFYQIYKKCDSHNPFCDHIFRAFDSDCDDQICFTEFLIGVSMPTAPKSRKELRFKLNWVFRLYDINQDGLIDKQEVQTVVDSFYTLLDKDKENTMALKVQSVIHANEIFEKLDIDKKMFITIEQFTESCIEDYKLLNLLAPSYSRRL